MRPVRVRQSRRLAYLLLETVVATGMLIVGLAVLGAQVQDSHTAVRKMERRIRAISLAEQHLAELEKPYHCATMLAEDVGAHHLHVNSSSFMDIHFFWYFFLFPYLKKILCSTPTVISPLVFLLLFH